MSVEKERIKLPTAKERWNLYKSMDTICLNCGLTYGSHHAGTTTWPNNYCPSSEGSMDWDEGPGTTFSAGPDRADIPMGTKAKKNVEVINLLQRARMVAERSL